MQISRRVFWWSVAVTLLLGVGIVANPWLTTGRAMLVTLLAVELLAAGIIIGLEVRRARHRSPIPANQPTTRRCSAWLVCVFVTVVGAWLSLFTDRWSSPTIVSDDKHYLRDSADWETTKGNLFVPVNQHMVTPTRLIAFLFAAVDDERWRVTLMAWSAIPSFVLVMVQLYWLVRREWDSECAGLLAVILFSISRAYAETITWFAASQWIIAVNILLFALNVVQRTVTAADRRRVPTACALAFVGPFSYAHGILVGPLTSAWLSARTSIRAHRVPWTCIVAPALASIAAGCVIAPILIHRQLQPCTHADGTRSVARDFDPVGGLVYGTRLFADLLIVNSIGPKIDPPALPISMVIVAVSVAGYVLHLRFRPAGWRMWPAHLLIVLPYSLAMPFRTWVDFDSIARIWTRYQLLPQLGLALLLSGILCASVPRWFCSTSGRLTLCQGICMLALTALLRGLHLP